MSANIPFHIQEEIIKRVLPVKSLIRFRSVSKQWKSLIHSSQFIIDHSVNPTTHPHHLLLSSKVGSDYKYLSIVDDDSFPKHKFSPTLPPIVKLLSNVITLDSSHGLVCFYGFSKDESNKTTKVVVVWNPSIRKSVSVVLPSPAFFEALAFGVCRTTSDPKIVMITRITSTDWKAEVFRLSSSTWTRVSMNCGEVNFLPNQEVVIDGVIHWVAHDLITNVYKIISFDLSSEEFKEVNLPENLACCRNLHVSKLNDTLVLLKYNTRGSRKRVCDLWMMLKGDVPKSMFTKVLTVKVASSDCSAFYKILGFRKNGQPVMKQILRRNGIPLNELEGYDPISDHIYGIGIYGSFFGMTSYTESLLLLNHSDIILQ